MEELKENLFNWYNFKENSDILDFGGNIANYIHGQKIDTKPEENKKYDYVILVGALEKAGKQENLAKAISFLKPDGKLLIAENNKFGIKNWNGKRDLTGSLDYREITRKYNSNEVGMLAKHDLKEMLDNEGVSNYKFYYLFPDYNLPNLIITDEYTLTEEDISRNFEAYEEGELVNFNENLALAEILKEDPKQAKFFANSFLVEASKEQIETDIKYVSFTNYRKKEYRVETILTNDYAIKKASNSEAQKHINNISDNLVNFNTKNSRALEVLEEQALKSKFIKEAPRLDLYLQSLNSYDLFLQEFNKYKEIVYQNTLEYSEVKDNLPEEIKTYAENKLLKMKFLKYTFTDMLPKNCFKVEDEYLFFDQEWCENYYPAEYIIYRAIRNTAGIANKYGENKIFKDLEIFEYIDLFEKLEENFRKKVIDEKMLYDVFDKKVVTREAMIADYTRKIIDRDVEIDKLKVDIEGRKAHVEELLGVISEKENQIIAISNSLSWRITKPLRDVSGKIHEIKSKKIK